MNRFRKNFVRALVATVGVVTLVSLVGTAVAAAATTSPAVSSFKYCPTAEVVRVWYGAAQHPSTVEPCGDLAAEFDHLFYRGDMLTTAMDGFKRLDVMEVQLRLHDFNYSPVVVDGQYGAQTAGAVTRYQRNHGLVADGKVGRQTWVSLFGLGSD
jgi:hypothetical protein